MPVSYRAVHTEFAICFPIRSGTQKKKFLWVNSHQIVCSIRERIKTSPVWVHLKRRRQHREAGLLVMLIYCHHLMCHGGSTTRHPQPEITGFGVNTGGSRSIRTHYINPNSWLIRKNHGACVPIFPVMNLMLNSKFT